MEAEGEGSRFIGLTNGKAGRQPQGETLQTLLLGTQARGDGGSQRVGEAFEVGSSLSRPANKEFGCCRRGFDAGVGHGVENRRVTLVTDARDDGQGELRAVGGQQIGVEAHEVAGSTSAASASNYNYTHRGNSYCHPFSGTPDSMYVWVSYYAASASSMGSVRAYLQGDSDFRDPNDCSDPTLYSGMAEAQFSRTTSSSTTPTWVQQRVPFTYDGTSSVNYILMSMTTNTTPGGGSAKDSLSVDDIEFIYSAWLDNLSINGTPIEGFQRDNLNYTLSLPDEASLSAATLSYVTQAADATVTIDTLTPDTFTRQFILHILAEDSLTSRTYTLTLTCPTPFEGINEPVHDSDASVLRLYPNPSNSLVHCILPQGISTSGTLTLFDASGRAATTLQVSDTNSPTLDTSRLPAGTYTLVFQTEGHISSQRLVIIH